MFPRDKITVINAIDALKPHTKLIDVLVEPEEKGRGREGIKRLNFRRNPRKSRFMEVALSELVALAAAAMVLLELIVRTRAMSWMLSAALVARDSG
jgi:hypothetical protein